MKGYIISIIVWSLVAVPLVFAACRVPRNVYLGIAGAVGVIGVTAWLAMAGYGYCITENMTTSLSGHVYLHKKGEPFQKGDLVAYRWHGGATYPAGTTFIKRVVGVPGEMVKRDGSEFWVGDRYIGRAKPRSRTGVPLTPASGGVIPEGEYFVATPSPDSLDSRYALTGNVRQIEIIGKAYEIF
jgi:conjugal transfer pilin signal peptidase TrbI